MWRDFDVIVHPYITKRKGETMNKEKRYWWLKLPENFFRSKEILYLKRKPDGYRLVYIYQAMMLESLKSGGALYFDSIGETPEEEIGMLIDEDPERVAVVVDFLKRYGLMIDSKDRSGYYMPFVEQHTGSEGASADRVRKFREKRKDDAASQGTAQSNESALHCNESGVTLSRRYREETELNLYQEKNTDREKKDGSILSSELTARPSLDEVINYCSVMKLQKVDPERFWRYNEVRNWKIKGNPVNWKALLERWDETQHDPLPTTHEPSYGSLARYEDEDPPWMRSMGSM